MFDGMTTAEMQEQYKVMGFALNMCIVERKSDGVKGTLDFDHSPRLYYNFQEAWWLLTRWTISLSIWGMT